MIEKTAALGHFCKAIHAVDQLQNGHFRKSINIENVYIDYFHWIISDYAEIIKFQ